MKYPAVLVSYRFTGFLDEVYAPLVTRLHHTKPLRQDELWRYAADFKTDAEKQLGVKLTRKAPGVGELEVYFDPDVSMEEKILFGSMCMNTSSSTPATWSDFGITSVRPARRRWRTALSP